MKAANTKSNQSTALSDERKSQEFNNTIEQVEQIKVIAENLISLLQNDHLYNDEFISFSPIMIYNALVVLLDTDSVICLEKSKEINLSLIIIFLSQASDTYKILYQKVSNYIENQHYKYNVCNFIFKDIIQNLDNEFHSLESKIIYLKFIISVWDDFLIAYENLWRYQFGINEDHRSSDPHCWQLNRMAYAISNIDSKYLEEGPYTVVLTKRLQNHIDFLKSQIDFSQDVDYDQYDVKTFRNSKKIKLSIKQTAMIFKILRDQKIILPLSNVQLAELINFLTGHNKHTIRPLLTPEAFDRIKNEECDDVKTNKDVLVDLFKIMFDNIKNTE